jgi:hypothetical protein
MTDKHTTDTISGNMPDYFDRMMGLLDGLPGQIKTRPSTVTAVPLMGVGGSTFYTVQTFRLRDEHAETPSIRFVTFLIVAGPDGYHRHVLPDEVAETMIRQRESLSKSAQRQHGKRLAAERAARGEQPAFLKGGRRRRRSRR